MLYQNEQNCPLLDIKKLTIKNKMINMIRGSFSIKPINSQFCIKFRQYRYYGLLVQHYILIPTSKITHLHFFFYIHSLVLIIHCIPITQEVELFLSTKAFSYCLVLLNALLQSCYVVSDSFCVARRQS